MLEVLAEVEAKEELAVVIGDLNKAVGNIIPGNNPKVSVGGAMVRELVETGKYSLANAHPKATGGPNTRYQPGAYDDISKRSCLDICIVSKPLVKYIDKVIIDEKLNFTPGYAVGNKIRYTDYFSLLVTFKGLPLKKGNVNTVHAEPMWNTNKPGGWKKFRDLTESNKKFKEVVADTESESARVDALEKKMNSELVKIKFASFGKIKNKKEKETSNKINEIRNKKENLLAEGKSENVEDKIIQLDSELLEALKEEQKYKVEKELLKLETVKSTKGNAARVFKLKTEIVGNKKSPQEPTVVKDPDTGEMVTDPTRIKEIIITFVKNLLTNREPSPGYETDLHIKRLLHETRMSEKLDDDIEGLSIEMFNDSLKELCTKKGGKYDFLSKSGYDFRNALFHLFKLVWKKEEIPTHWKHTTLVQLWKCKGDFRDQKYMRNLHIKEFEPKFFGHIVINLAKEILLKNTSIFQIGAKKGHRAAEHIYVMKSCIQMYKTLKKPLIICFWDYSTFFDSESEIDVMNEIYNLGVRGKLYRLLYKINQETYIQVKTAVGVTRVEKRSEGISQGTVDGAVLSSAGIGGGVDEYFRDSEHEIWYHEVRLQPQSFVDDVARMAAGRLEAQAGNNLMETIAETKLLSYNMDKSVYMVVGEGGNKKGMEDDLEKDPLMLCGQKMKRTESYSYLGTAISEKGIGESVKETIKGKLGKVKHMIFEIKSVIEDFRNNVPGGICTGTLIWEAAVVPFLFHSSECWM